MSKKLQLVDISEDLTITRYILSFIKKLDIGFINSGLTEDECF